MKDRLQIAELLGTLPYLNPDASIPVLEFLDNPTGTSWTENEKLKIKYMAMFKFLQSGQKIHPDIMLIFLKWFEGAELTRI